MKLKEINRTAIQSWSPAQHHPVYLATGTSAQQLDASFSTHASLEFFELDLSEPGLDMKSCGSFSSPHRYHKLAWGPYGMDAPGRPSGVLVAGGENGNVILYDPARIMAGHGEVVVAESARHTGPVRALDVNPFQTNLVASGGNESEIYIWDMNNFGSPMTPGPKTQPLEDISCVAWNRQVQHILASASPSGRASVWDLRKNDLIIKVSDHSNRMHCSSLAWNPEVATQMVVASEDDRMPVVQMWDLRFATSPLKILEHHTRGVLSVAWSLADPDLLLSCGKDNRILCWNPNTAEVLYELPTSSQWCFDIQWCPRNPAVLSAAGFDGRIDIYSIMGGGSQAQSQRHAEQISTSFGNMDPFGTGQTLPPLQLPQAPAPPAAAAVAPLKKPPKWIRRPVGASFAFGGKLVSPESGGARQVQVSQVVTEAALLRRSEQLQRTLGSGGFADFCQAKIDGAEDPFEESVWSFLKANFEGDVRRRYLQLLGYNKEELALKIAAALEEKPAVIAPPQVEVAAPPAVVPVATPQLIPDLSVLPPADTPEAAFDLIAAANLQPADTPEAEEEAPPAEVEEEEKVEEQLEEEEEEEEEEIPLDQEAVALAEEEEVEEEPSPPADDPALVQDPALSEEVPPPLEGEAAPDTPPEASSEFDAPPPVEASSLFDAPPEASSVSDAPPPVEASSLVDAPPPVEASSLVDAPPPVEASSLFDAPPPAEASSLFDAPPPAEASSLFDAPPPAEASSLFDAPPPAEASSLFDAPASAEASAFFDLPPAVEASSAFDAPPAVEASAPLEVAAPVAEVPTPVEVPPPAPTPAGGVSLSISQDVDGLITQALLTGDFEGAVELCLHDDRLADGIILAVAGGSELLDKTQKKYFTKTHSRVTKLIGAVVTKDWRDVLKTCELSSWKEALAAVMTYAQPDDFSSLCDLLGGRLDAAADPALRRQACLCYICAGNVEQLVSCWSRQQDGPSPLSLQDLVEKVVVLRRAVEQSQGAGPAAAASGALLAEKMSRYAALLASQGSLATAIAYLPDGSDQLAVQQLRDRLSRALGQTMAAAAAAPPVEPQSVAAAVAPQPAALPAAPLPRQPFTPVQPAPTAAAPQHYYQPVRAASTVTSWSNQTPTALLNVPPPPPASEQQVEPPRPGPGMPPPPAASAPAYVSHQYQPPPQGSQYPAGGGGVPLYQPQLYSSSSSSAPPPAPPPGFLSHYTSQPAPPLYPGQQAAIGPASPPPAPAAPAPLFYPSSSSSSSFQAPPSSSGASFQHGGPGSPLSYLPPPPPAASGTQTNADLPPASQRSGPQNGWNDPPALTRAPKKKQVPQTYTPLAPITAPIMSPLGADPRAQPPASSGAPQGAGGAPQVPYSGQGQQQQQQQPLSPPPMNPAAPKSSQEGAPGAPTGEVIQPLRSLPAEKIAKKPIPDEHLVLKTTFEGLIQKCLAVASDPQTKRKLDDANKRLEALYDKLREQTLSPAIVGGLHNMARSIESRCYTESLNIHTHIVSSSNFSETSAFMPVLKVVLTQANKLGV